MASMDVIIPCYNYGRYLRRCVESVRNSAAGDLRILIIDDASADDSLAVAQELARDDSRIQVISHRENKGHITTYNEGIDWIEADYMLLLSADDFLAPGALGRAVGLMQANRQVAFVHGRHIDVTEEAGRFVPVRFVRGRYVPLAAPAAMTEEPGEARMTIVGGRDFISQCCTNATNPVGTVTAVVRGALQKRVGGYRHDLPHSGDFEMWLRLAARGDVGVLQAVQGYTQIHDTNMRHQYIAGDHMVRDYRQRLAAFEVFFAENKDLLPEAPIMAATARRRLAELVFWDAVCKSEEAQAARGAELLDLARAIDPNVGRGLTWSKLSVKRAFGPKMWRALSPSLQRMKSAFRAI